MTGIWSAAKLSRSHTELAALAAAARRDLARLNFPASGWVPATLADDGSPVLDVLVIGGGMCGQTAGFALMKGGVRRVRIVDRSRRGEEGPWGTYARMEILRSPKHLTGPDLGVPSLTFRAWYEAAYGTPAWDGLHKAGRLDWRDYLLFVRDTVGIGIENGTAVEAIRPRGALIEADLSGERGAERVLARRIVLATGRDGSGGARLPQFPGLDWGDGARRGRVHHSAEEIDFSALRGRTVAVLGAGASAFDCAAAALEAGASRVTMSCRRSHLPQVNKPKWASFPGLLKGAASLDDATRWRLFSYLLAAQVPPPFESVLRCDAHPAFSIAFAETWRDVALTPEGVRILTDRGEIEASAVILGTGFDVDLGRACLLASHADDVLLWRHRIRDAEASAHPEASRFPYLGRGFELQPRPGHDAAWLRQVHLFNWGATASHGALAGDIPGLAVGAERLASELSASLLAEDFDRHWAELLAHDDQELRPTSRYHAAERHE